MIDFEELGKAEQVVLEEVFMAIKQDRTTTQAEIVKNNEQGPSQITRALNTLEEQDLAAREEYGKTNKVSITDKGAKVLLHMIAGTEEELNNLLSLHNFSAKYRIRNFEKMEENRSGDFREWFFNHSEIEHTYDESNDSIRFKESGYQFRITREHVIVTIDEIVGDNPTRLKNRACERAQKGAEIVEDKTSIKLSGAPLHVYASICNQHLAIIKDPLSKIVEESNEVGTKVEITDREGNLLFWTDQSDGRNDLEAGEVGWKGMSEDNIQKILDFYTWIVENPETHRKARKWMEKEFA